LKTFVNAAHARAASAGEDEARNFHHQEFVTDRERVPRLGVLQQRR
jgi:hypothetical protein